MHVHAHVASAPELGVQSVPAAAGPATPGAARIRAGRLRATALKPFTYSVMHLAVAIGVAYALTGDWRIALGVGVIEPMVQTLAYMIHERVWERVLRRGGRAAAPRPDAAG